MTDLPEPPKPRAGMELNEYVLLIYRWLVEVKANLEREK